jgi:DNA-binding Xre family transcriptional regulator
MKTKIKKLCQAAGITTAYQLQKKTDLSPSQAARLYRDEVEAISISVLEKLCDALKCSPNDIFGYNEPQTLKPQTVKVDTEKPASKPGTPQTTASGKDLMTVAVVMSYLNKSESSVLRYIKKYGLKAEKVGGGWKILRKDVLEFEQSDFYINEAKK